MSHTHTHTSVNVCIDLLLINGTLARINYFRACVTFRADVYRYESQSKTNV